MGAWTQFGAALLLALICLPFTVLADLPEVTTAQRHVDDMNVIIQEAFDQLESARSEEDIQRVNCISEGVTVMRGLLKIAIAQKKFGELDSQVRSCGGPDLAGTVDGRPDIEKILDDDLPTVDPVVGLKDIELFLERPPSASQFY